MAELPKADRVERRVYAKGTWKLQTAAHFGGDDDGVADMTLLRDSSGTPYVPGSSIAGVAQAYLAGVMTGSSDTTRPSLFGPQRVVGANKQTRMMSVLHVSDAAATRVETALRDGVRISPESGVAADSAKYDVEVLEPGAELELRFECVLREGDDAPALLQQLRQVLDGFGDGSIRLGARTRRGYGRGRVAQWDVRDLDMHCPKDVSAWLQQNPWCRPSATLPQDPIADQRSLLRISGSFSLVGSMLIRSPWAPTGQGTPTAGREPDTMHLEAAGRPVVPGTALAGALRHRLRLILHILELDTPDVDAVVASLFGPVHHGETRGKGAPLWASRLRVEEAVLKNVEPYRQDRAAIDRFTGGSLDTALFTEQAVRPKPSSTRHLDVSWELEEPDPSEVGMMLLLLKDLWFGHLPLGGEVGVGRGTLSGEHATVEWVKPGTQAQQWTLERKPTEAMAITEGNPEELDEHIRAAGKLGSKEPAQT